MVSVPAELQLRKEPKQKRSRELVQKILDAAVLLAEQKGLAAFNTNAVAERAGVDVASIYQYFPNKESILYWAAERWLRRIRDVCETMESEEHQALTWQAFFARYGELVTAIPEYRSAFSSMQSLWTLYPDYQHLSDEHQTYMVDFLVRHCLRLGASMDEASLRGLIIYLYVSSNSVIEASLTSDSTLSESLNAWNYQVWMSLLGEAFADQKNNG